ncbi:uncharacterized protein LOC136768295 [Amia ocellicauda]|uniref:uncharacterized protein LOC136768295 n=1 Tax=Amia ocellicauda TaxID=2972642 RepID=UPI00346449B2
MSGIAPTCPVLTCNRSNRGAGCRVRVGSSGLGSSAMAAGAAAHTGRVSPAAGESSSSCPGLERIINRSALTTQRATHRHILALGERCCKTLLDKRVSPREHRPHLPSEEEEEEEEDVPCWTDRELRAALRREAEERERALQEQRETLQAQFTEALESRGRLEAEERQGLRVQLAAQAEEALRRERARLQEESAGALRRAGEELSARLGREAEEEREREAERRRAEAQAQVAQCVQEAVSRVREQCHKEAETERGALRETHRQREAELQARIEQLQQTVCRVTEERAQREQQLKEVWSSFRSFLDLSTSGLHSDFLLPRPRLGPEPGLVETGVQTDSLLDTPINETTPPRCPPSPDSALSGEMDTRTLHFDLPVSYF